MRPFSVFVAVAVASGTGDKDFGAFGHCKIVCITPPSAGAVYDYELDNKSDSRVEGMTGNKGTRTFQVDVPLVHSGHIHISNATVDGEYEVELICLATAA
jgi:hypothetical protein